MTDRFPGDPRSNRERMPAGDLYVADDPELHEKMARADRLSRRYEDLVTTDPAAAQAVLADLLGSLGEGNPARVIRSV